LVHRDGAALRRAGLPVHELRRGAKFEDRPARDAYAVGASHRHADHHVLHWLTHLTDRSPVLKVERCPIGSIGQYRSRSSSNCRRRVRVISRLDLWADCRAFRLVHT